MCRAKRPREDPQRAGGRLQAKERGLGRNQIPWSWAPSSRTMRNFYCVSHPVGGTLPWQPPHTTTTSIWTSSMVPVGLSSSGGCQRAPQQGPLRLSVAPPPPHPRQGVLQSVFSKDAQARRHELPLADPMWPLGSLLGFDIVFTCL